VLLKRNVMEAWWRSMVQLRDDIVGLDASILMSPRVWEASGHVATFTDPLVDCRKCKERWRADQIEGRCPNCGSEDLTSARAFNLMFKTHVGPVEDEGSVAYLRPETAQGIFVNFANVLQTSRKKPPFGIAQMGKSFRNEITPGNFIFRTREFEQMEMEFFVPPADGPKWFEYWCAERLAWYIDLGIPADRLRLRNHDPEELSHYSAGTADVEFLYPWGWGELEGVANRTDYDLGRHSECSGQRLEYFDQASGERFMPHVIEPAAGVGRSMMAFLLAAYDTDEVNGEARSVLRLHHRLAPIKVAVLPLSKKDTLVPTAREVLHLLQPHFSCDYDETQAIGRRYRRQDEIGTPFCVTVDFESLEDRAATVRDRDSLAQERIPIAGLVEHLRGRLDPGS
ncbi:MAG: glycine--tRNA ligase, partial [Acidimicrobiales bacterium]